MFSRLKNMIGMMFLGAGLVWILGITGASDVEVAQSVYSPVLPTMLEAAAGVPVMFVGMLLLDGMEEDR